MINNLSETQPSRTFKEECVDFVPDLQRSEALSALVLGHEEDVEEVLVALCWRSVHGLGMVHRGNLNHVIKQSDITIYLTKELAYKYYIICHVDVCMRYIGPLIYTY
jgi:hypothetical protein